MSDGSDGIYNIIYVRKISDQMPGSMPQYNMSQHVTDRMPDKMSECMSDCAPDRIPDEMSHSMSGYTDRMSVGEDRSKSDLGRAQAINQHFQSNQSCLKITRL